ncbi:hypothetical protein MPC1_10450002 [Methylocella tundrae]|nr:hypothetical protein MPC1_10450002 [Methylocella tundrae]
MAMRGVDDDAVDAGVDQHFGALVPLVADGRGRRDAKPPLGVLAGERMQGRLFHVLHGDEADTAEILIDDDQLFETMLVQHAARLILAHPFPHGDQALGHQMRDRLQRIVGKTHVAIGQNAAEPRRFAAGATLDHGNAGNAVAAHQRQRVGQRFVRENGDRINHHAALVALDLADLLGLLGRLEIAMDDADAAGLRQRDGELRLGHSVHRRRDDRDVQADRRGQAGAQIDAARHDLGMAGQKQYVVEGKGLAERGTRNKGQSANSKIAARAKPRKFLRERTSKFKIRIDQELRAALSTEIVRRKGGRPSNAAAAGQRGAAPIIKSCNPCPLDALPTAFTEI